MKPEASPWWPIIASSGVLSLALLGDSLIYAVLPIHAESFGVSIVWVGVLLSANRFVRVFVYGWAAQFTERFGFGARHDGSDIRHRLVQQKNNDIALNVFQLELHTVQPGKLLSN